MDALRPTALRTDPDCALEAMIGGRSEQQDSAKILAVTLTDGRKATLLIVCDGMGGAAGGQVASRTAVDAFEMAFEGAVDATLNKRLRDALEAANAAIAARVRQDRSLKGMGCTLVAAVIDASTMTWISVGDSLLYSVTRRGLERMNEDHSLAPILDQAVKRGELTREAAEVSPQRSMLRSALTGGPMAMVDVGRMALEPDMRLIVASDGILSLSDDVISGISQGATSARELVASILEKVRVDMAPDQDNLTVVALIAPGTGGGALPIAPTVPLWPKLVLGIAIGVLVLASVALAVIYGGKGPSGSTSAATNHQAPAAASEQAGAADTDDGSVLARDQQIKVAKLHPSVPHPHQAAPARERDAPPGAPIRPRKEEPAGDQARKPAKNADIPPPKPQPEKTVAPTLPKAALSPAKPDAGDDRPNVAVPAEGSQTAPVAHSPRGPPGF